MKYDTRAYKIWSGMKSRCFNVNDSGYSKYGGRGITVCERWMKFDNFYADMGDPKIGESIDRINNNGNYEPGNCEWVSIYTQANNTSRNVFFTCNGVTLTLASWARIRRIHPKTIKARISRGWSVDRAILTPAMNNQYF